MNFVPLWLNKESLDMPQLTYASIDQTILNTLARPKKSYWGIVFILFVGVLIGAACWAYQIFVGIGVGGQNNPVGWGTYLINFCLLGRYCPFRYPDLCHFTPVSGRMAQSHRPGGRDHDRFCGVHCRAFSLHPSGDASGRSII